LVVDLLLKNNYYYKTFEATWKLGILGNKILGVANKVSDLMSSMGAQAVERAWGILQKMPNVKLWEIEDIGKYLRYLEDVKVARFGWATINDHLATFDRTFPDIRVNMQVHHAIPQATLSRFPALGIDPKQMHSLENLRGIPNTVLAPDGSGDELHTFITRMWEQDFFPNYGPGNIPTMQEMNYFAKQIDDQFGHLFNPPVR
jgi:hypothetical protein